MPSPYLTYALAALSFGLSVAFFRISDENSELSRAKIAVEMRLETAEGEAKAFREKLLASGALERGGMRIKSGPTVAEVADKHTY